MQDVKTILEHYGVLNKQFRLKEVTHTEVAIPIILEKLLGKCKSSLLRDWNIEHTEGQIVMPFSKSHLIKLTSIRKVLVDSISDLFYGKTKKLLCKGDLSDLPNGWQIHGDMLLLPKECMVRSTWQLIKPEIWEIFCSVLHVARIAKCERICENGYRSSQVKLVKGENGWISRKENGITYLYDITKCMFSDGNITEKLRIASFDCRGMIVVDLFAGIGYFVLPYIIHAGAKKVYACEWNPDAAEALKLNLEVNKVSERCCILFGDNKLVAPKCIADHVNLGLIPSSEESWPVACHALNPSKGGWLHIHSNISEIDIVSPNDEGADVHACKQQSSRAGKMKKWIDWATRKICVLKKMLDDYHMFEWVCRVDHIEHVKSYAPHIDHIVVDIECRPAPSY